MHQAASRFEEEAGRLLDSIDSWAQAEEQARRTFDAKMQHWYGASGS